MAEKSNFWVVKMLVKQPHVQEVQKHLLVALPADWTLPPEFILPEPVFQAVSAALNTSHPVQFVTSGRAPDAVIESCSCRSCTFSNDICLVWLLEDGIDVTDAAAPNA